MEINFEENKSNELYSAEKKEENFKKQDEVNQYISDIFNEIIKIDGILKANESFTLGMINRFFMQSFDYDFYMKNRSSFENLPIKTELAYVDESTNAIFKLGHMLSQDLIVIDLCGDEFTRLRIHRDENNVMISAQNTLILTFDIKDNEHDIGFIVCIFAFCFICKKQGESIYDVYDHFFCMCPSRYKDSFVNGKKIPKMHSSLQFILDKSLSVYYDET